MSVHLLGMSASDLGFYLWFCTEARLFVFMSVQISVWVVIDKKSMCTGTMIVIYFNIKLSNPRFMYEKESRLTLRFYKGFNNLRERTNLFKHFYLARGSPN